MREPYDSATARLYRSCTEIERILKEMVDSRTAIATEIGPDEQLFVSRLLAADQQADALFAAYSENKAANNSLMVQPKLCFRANHEHAHVEFEAFSPTDATLHGLAVVRFAFPQSLLWSRRRKHPRMAVLPAVSLRCVADTAGVAPFEARIIDISLGGMGGMVYDSNICLEPGTLLKNCRIIMPGGDAVHADLEVRYINACRDAEGKNAYRSGVRFVNRPDGLEALINLFVRNLDEDAYGKSAL